MRETAFLCIFTNMNGSEKFLELKNDTARIILSLQDEAILARVREILEEAVGADGGWYDSLDAEDKAAVDQAEAEVAAGRVLSQKQVEENLNQWLKE